MLSLNSISAWIEVNGKELEQYGVEEDPDHNKVTCWIPTQADQVGRLNEDQCAALYPQQLLELFRRIQG